MRKDREQLAGLLNLMNGWERALRRDECGDWLIEGTHGHVYVDGAGFLACVFPGSTRGWNVAKAKLGRFRASQDGDQEGCIQVREPTPAEAETLRQVIGVRRRRHLAPAQREAAIARLRLLRQNASNRASV
jgi:hypothetical protein